MVEANKSAIFVLSLAFMLIFLLGFTSACHCGDDYINTVSEQCDDGNTVSGDGCSSTCKLEYCGDSLVNRPSEQCDKGALNGVKCIAGYGSSCTYCTTSCKILTINNFCGDWYRQDVEECDDGNNWNGDGCSSTCKVEITPPPFCGDGTCNGAETCSTCSTDCGTCPIPDPICGNGIIQSGETCDDGNTVSGDGCSSICKTEEEECEDNTTTIKKNHFVQFCSTNWECSGWSECSNGIMTRECIDTNHCGLIYDIPYEQTDCNELSNALVEVKNAHNFWLISLIILLVILLVILVNLL